jgi:hypothetical protein
LKINPHFRALNPGINDAYDPTVHPPCDPLNDSDIQPYDPFYPSYYVLDPSVQ